LKALTAPSSAGHLDPASWGNTPQPSPARFDELQTRLKELEKENGVLKRAAEEDELRLPSLEELATPPPKDESRELARLRAQIVTQQERIEQLEAENVEWMKAMSKTGQEAKDSCDAKCEEEEDDLYLPSLEELASPPKVDPQIQITELLKEIDLLRAANEAALQDLSEAQAKLAASSGLVANAEEDDDDLKLPSLEELSSPPKDHSAVNEQLEHEVQKLQKELADLRRRCENT